MWCCCLTWGLFGADVDKTVFSLSFAGVCWCLLPMFCAFRWLDLILSRRNDGANRQTIGVGAFIGKKRRARFLFKRCPEPFV